MIYTSLKCAELPLNVRVITEHLGKSAKTFVCKILLSVIGVRNYKISHKFLWGNK